jgi:hypothetical protein
MSAPRWRNAIAATMPAMPPPHHDDLPEISGRLNRARLGEASLGEF